MTPFKQALALKFNDAVAQKTEEFFQSMRLPTPEAYDEYLAATAGFIIFISMAGLVVRIENKIHDPNVINDRPDHPLVLQPLGSLDLGDAVLEVCPAIRLGAQHDDCEKINFQLIEDGLELDDHQAANLGYLPDINGGERLVVIDRLAVVQVHRSCESVWNLLEKYGNPQAPFSSLKKSFRRGQATGDMFEFVRLAAAAKDRGLLVNGWEEENHLHDMRLAYNKTPEAKNAADHYMQRIARHYGR